MQKLKRNSMFYGAILLTAGSLGLRLVQMVFQVYITRIMGAAGLGRMQLIMTVGGFAAVIASGGVRIAATCLAAEEAGMDRPGGVRTAISCCCVYGSALSILVGGLLFILADQFALWWIDDPSAALPLRVFAVFLPVTVLWSVFNGYFTAAGRITELVGLEFFERILNIVLVILGIQLGLFDPCTTIFLGSSIATLLSFLIVLKLYRKTVERGEKEPFLPMMKRLIKLTVPLGLNDIFKSGLNTIENIIVPKGLKKYGSGEETAMASYGTICGMVFPVITFPSVILYSLSDLLVPEMARCRAKGRSLRTQFLADKCIRLTLLFSLAVAGLGLLLGQQVGMLLFQSREAGMYIQLFSPLVVMLYIDAIVDGMLKGLSQQLYTVRYNTLTSFLDVAFLIFLLPRFGITGYLISFTVTHAINFYLSMRRLILVTGYLPGYKTAIKGGLSCFLALFVLWSLPKRGLDLPQTLMVAALFLSIFMLLVLLSNTLKREDLVWLRSLIRNRKETGAS